MADKREKHPKNNVPKSEDQKLDKALEDSFPASDPPSVTDPQSHLGSSKQKPAAGNRNPGRE
jgi:hypothetical protein